MSEEEALKQFRVWLWHELQDKYNVVSTEMRQLARAHKREEEVEILVPKDAPHGALIVRALLWLADNADLSEPIQTKWTEPGPTYEPILPDGTITCRAKMDPKYIVWIHGNRQSRIGVVVAYGQAFVPEYGIVPLKRFHWVNRKLAQSPILQQLLNYAFDETFMTEEGNEPVEYEPFPAYATEERFDSWVIDESLEEVADNEEWVATAEADVRTPVEQLAEEVGDTATAHAILQVLSTGSDEQVTYPFWVEPDMIRPVYKHKGENEPLKIKSAEAQVKRKGWIYANKEETQYYMKIFVRYLPQQKS